MRGRSKDRTYAVQSVGMWVKGPARFPQLSLITHLGLWKYELMASPSFSIMFSHRRTEAQPMMKVLVDRCARGCQGRDGARGLADAEGPICIGGRWMKAP
jgi:hypothetical protein